MRPPGRFACFLVVLAAVPRGEGFGVPGDDGGATFAGEADAGSGAARAERTGSARPPRRPYFDFLFYDQRVEVLAGDDGADEAAPSSGFGSTAQGDLLRRAVPIVVKTSEGIGLRLSGRLRVLEVVAGAPPSVARVIRPGDRLVGIDDFLLPPTTEQYPLQRVRQLLKGPFPPTKTLRFLLRDGDTLASRQRAPAGGSAAATLDDGHDRVAVALPRGVPHGMILSSAEPPAVAGFAPAVLLSRAQQRAVHAMYRTGPEHDARLLGAWRATAEALCAAAVVAGDQQQGPGGAFARPPVFPMPLGTAADPKAPPPHPAAQALGALAEHRLAGPRRDGPAAWGRLAARGIKLYALLGNATEPATEDACALLWRRLQVPAHGAGWVSSRWPWPDRDELRRPEPPAPGGAPRPRAADTPAQACVACGHDSVLVASPMLLSGRVVRGVELVSVGARDVRSLDRAGQLRQLYEETHNATAVRCRGPPPASATGLPELDYAMGAAAASDGAAADPAHGWRYCVARDALRAEPLQLSFRSVAAPGSGPGQWSQEAEAAASAALAFGFKPGAVTFVRSALASVTATYTHRRALLRRVEGALRAVPATGDRPSGPSVPGAALRVPGAAGRRPVGRDSGEPTLGTLHLFSDELALNVTVPALHAASGPRLRACEIVPLGLATPADGCGPEAAGEAPAAVEPPFPPPIPHVVPRPHPDARHLPPRAAPMATLDGAAAVMQHGGCTVAEKAGAAAAAAAAALVVASGGDALMRTQAGGAEDAAREMGGGTGGGYGLPVVAVPARAWDEAAAYHDMVMRDLHSPSAGAAAWTSLPEMQREMAYRTAQPRTRRTRLGYLMQCVLSIRVAGGFQAVQRAGAPAPEARFRACGDDEAAVANNASAAALRDWSGRPDYLIVRNRQQWQAAVCELRRRVGTELAHTILDLAEAPTSRDAALQEVLRRFPLRAPRIYMRWLPAGERAQAWVSHAPPAGDLAVGPDDAAALVEEHLSSPAACPPVGGREITSLVAL